MERTPLPYETIINQQKERKKAGWSVVKQHVVKKELPFAPQMSQVAVELGWDAVKQDIQQDDHPSALPKGMPECNTYAR